MRIINCWAEYKKNDRFRCCFLLFDRLGFTINNLHSGAGFTLYLGFLIYSQAWFGELNEVHWEDGKYRFVFPFLKYKKYSQLKGWYK